MDFWVSCEESIFVVSSSPNKNAGWMTRSIPVILVTMLMIWVWVICSWKIMGTKFELLNIYVDKFHKVEMTKTNFRRVFTFRNILEGTQAITAPVALIISTSDNGRCFMVKYVIMFVIEPRTDRVKRSKRLPLGNTFTFLKFKIYRLHIYTYI